MYNIKAAENLITMYSSLSLFDINSAIHSLKEEYPSMEICGDAVMQELTGFGQPDTCILCMQAKKLAESDSNGKRCCHCIYHKSEEGFCIEDTYQKLADAKTAEEIFYAIQDRISYIKKVLKLFKDGD